MLILDVLEPGDAGPFQSAPETPFAAVISGKPRTQSEKADNYDGVIAQLNAKLRVARGACASAWNFDPVRGVIGVEN